MEEEKQISEEIRQPQETGSVAVTPEPENQAPQKSRRQLRKEKKKLRKQLRKEKKRQRKQQRKDQRRERRAAFRDMSPREKVCHVLTGLGRKLFSLIKVVVIIAMLVTIVRVNYKETGAAVKFMSMLARYFSTLPLNVTQEEIYEMAPPDAERGAIIDASAPIGEGETWAIYIYMVGSDLEASKNNQLSEMTQYLALAESNALVEEQQAQTNQEILGMVDTILENGLDLPEIMFEKAVAPTSQQTTAQAIDQTLNSMAPDSNAGSMDIQEILAVTLPENVKVVLQPGGAVSWGYNMINPNRTQRFLYDSNGIQQVYDGHISNMADPNTLVDFLTFCETEYPADHTMVIFWNHGAGAFGYGVDSIYQNDRLNLPDLRWAFEQVYTPDEENPPLDIIGFDACLMASMEVANTFHGFGGYLLGSEEVEPGAGWDYTTWLSALAENPRMNAMQLGKAVTDAYIDYYARTDVPVGAGMELFSMLDLRDADDLYQAYSDFAAAALRESVDHPGTAAYLGRAANSSIKFGYTALDVSNTVDLGLFMQGVQGPLESSSQRVLDVMDDMVIYSRSCNTVWDATGITVYYPASVNCLKGFTYATRYIHQVCEDPYIQALYYYKVAGCLPEEMQLELSELGLEPLMPLDTQPMLRMKDAEFTLSDDGSFTMPFDAEAQSLTQEYRFNLLQVQGDSAVVRSLGYDDYLSVDSNGQLVCQYDGKWSMINGQPLRTQVVASTGDTIRYSARITYNDQDAYLLLNYDVQTGENKIMGVQLITSRSEYDLLVDRKTQELMPGDVIVPIYVKYDFESCSYYNESGESIIYSANTKVVDKTIPDGHYLFYVSLVDARGDKHDMKLVSFQIRNGVISGAQLEEVSGMY